MMTAIRSSDMVAVLGLVREVAAVVADTPFAWQRRMLALLPDVVDCDVTGYTEVNVLTGVSVSAVYPDNWDISKLTPVFNAHVHEHPLVRPADMAAPVRTLSDCMSRSEYRNLGLYREFYRLFDVEDQAAIVLPSAWPTLIGVTVNRKGWGFSGRDRSILAILRPHLAGIRDQAERFQQLREQADQWRTTLQRLPRGLIGLSASGAVAWATELGRTFLDSYFAGARRAPGDALPQTVRRWLQTQGRPGETAVPGAPLLCESDRGRLVIHCVQSGDEPPLLVLDEEPRPATATHALQRLGLTPREAEVLHWLIQGKTDPQIATVLDVSPRTVQKHVERVFRKLDVQTRTAAAARVRERLAGTSGS